MPNVRTLLLWFALLALPLTACDRMVERNPQPEPQPLTVITHDSFAASEPVIAAFEAENNATVTIITAGDAGTLTNQLILNRAAPVADVAYGVDNTFLSRALAEDVFAPYQSPLVADVDPAFQLDPENRVTPIDYGDVCLNYDRAYFNSHNLPVPTRLDDLTDPAYRGLLVVQNPVSSSPGLAFLLTTIATYGEEGYLDYWSALQANDLLIVEDWTTAYYGEFSGGSGAGTRPLVVSYASSPPVEVLFASPQPDEAPTAAVVAPQTCFRQIEFAGVLQNAARPDLARAWIDFMLSPTFQADIPLNMFVYPVNPDVALPDLFIEHAEPVIAPATLAPDLIAANRETWLNDWTDTILR